MRCIPTLRRDTGARVLCAAALLASMVAAPAPSGAKTAPVRPLMRPAQSSTQLAEKIDAYLEEVWKETFTEGAAPATDAALLRRLSIDLRGVIPYPDEVRQFTEDRQPDRMQRWTDWFLETPEYAEHSAQQWEQVLIGRKGDADGLDREGFRRWLRKSFLTNRPWDRLARDLLLAEGLPQDTPAANFWLRYESNPEDMAGRVSRIFLGTRIECAQCHDHPYADVTRQEFYGFAAFFARTETYRDYDRAGGNRDRRGIRESKKGEVRMPAMKKGERDISVSPLFFGERFDAKTLEELEASKKKRARGRDSEKKDSKKSAASMRAAKGKKTSRSSSEKSTRRRELVRWLTDSKNKYFARSIVNRVWAQLLGKGFVNPIDDFSTDSKIQLIEVLDLLADDFRDNGYDLRRLISTITQTRAYAQSAQQAVPGGMAPGEDHDLFSTVPILPLSAEVLARSVLRATGLEEPQPEANARQVRKYVEQARRDFARRFGVDEDEKRSEFQGTVLQVLMLFNGSFTSGNAPASRPYHAEYQKKYPGNLDVVLHGVPPDAHVDQLFLATLGRVPSASERDACGGHVAAARDDSERQKALADVQWALLNSAEFLHRN